MPKLPGIKDAIGRAFGKEKETASLPKTTTLDTPITAETTVLSDTTGTITVTEMTPEQVTARNYAVLSKVSHNPPVHTVFCVCEV
jgi:hypothetical protein